MTSKREAVKDPPPVSCPLRPVGPAHAAGGPAGQVCGAPGSRSHPHAQVGLPAGPFKRSAPTQSRARQKNRNWLMWASNLTQMHKEGVTDFRGPDSTFQFVKKPGGEGLYMHQRPPLAPSAVHKSRPECGDTHPPCL